MFKIDLNNLGGQILLATPSMHQSIFKDAVIFLCSHSEEGAMGIIVNHPNKIKLNKIFDQLEISYEKGKNFEDTLKGGPLSRDRGFVLHSPCSKSWESTSKISENIAISTSKDILFDIAKGNGPSELLVILGYSSWSGGQLERELTESSWLTMPSDHDILFNSDPLEKAPQAAKLMGFDLKNLMPNHGNA